MIERFKLLWTCTNGYDMVGSISRVLDCSIEDIFRGQNVWSKLEFNYILFINYLAYCSQNDEDDDKSSYDPVPAIPSKIHNYRLEFQADLPIYLVRFTFSISTLSRSKVQTNSKT